LPTEKNSDAIALTESHCAIDQNKLHSLISLCSLKTLHNITHSTSTSFCNETSTNK